ncbi:MAG: hypothetical protein DLM53_02255 [Candidatus Eremiobacter antarcticus]|nr:hypothetical protein [Candidatus Eremiobacteraeota bacterium]MBC5808231.1 hypothetical protein [Candidatus Eremiobacteraeota bacterium]PZR63616.1 MAG: hypothetical protein DLM53_02255 [Candidatus Eremiobacter sp. RRmetagenome_bin22]
MTLPAVTLIPESDVTDERVREAFRDIKNALRVPIVNAVFQAYAAVPKFLDLAWRRLRPSILTAQFGLEAAKINRLAESGTSGWSIGDHAALLRARNIGNADLRMMRQIVELFAVVNAKLLILTNAVDAALSGATVGGAGTSGPVHNDDRERNLKEFRGVRLHIVDERDAPPRVRSIYDEIKQAFALPFVPNDYRAMAAYPDWLDIAWKDCRAMFQDLRHKALEREVEGAGHDAVRTLPHRFSLSQYLLESNGLNDAERARLAEINRMFVRALPRLVISGEVCRRGLGQETVW